MKSRIIFLIGVVYASLAFTFSGPGYQSNLDKALAEARAKNKTILMVFAGSDWCRPCMQFKKEILENPEFVKYADEKLVILYLDFPSRKKNQLPEAQKAHNEKLAEQYNKQGAFPHIVLMDKDRKIITPVEFHNQTAADFISECKKHLHS